MIAIRSLLFNLAFYINVFILMVIGIPMFILPQRIGWIILNAWSRSSSWWLKIIVGTPVEIRGIEYMPKAGCIVAAKHQSSWDTFALLSMLPHPAYIYKKQLARVPMFGWFLMRYDMIPVDRGKGQSALRDMHKRVKNELKRDRQIVIFPEGTRRAVAAVPDYKQGLALLYRTCGVPCVPVALNSGLTWPRRKFGKFRGKIIIEFCKPIQPGLKRDEFVKELQETIENTTNRLLIETALEFPDIPRTPELDQLISAASNKSDSS
ncbi:MAG: 1-acyl-sn-glycerol-3-phosphate acyltransferase [Cohaesibacteraceae bacterium]|nr:1-acyl-sn-glycerol-3-phosphate acyltransferase [Cohaesibacteraceae bacterium]